MDYTKPTRNHESFKAHFLQFINCNDIRECHDIPRRGRDYTMFYIYNYYAMVFTDNYIYEYYSARTTLPIKIHKSEYNTDIINLLSLYNHYFQVYNRNKPKYLLVTNDRLYGTHHIPTKNANIRKHEYMSYNNMFKHIIDYYCDNKECYQIIIEL